MVSNVALWTGEPGSPYIPFVNIAPIVGGTNGISPIFLTLCILDLVSVTYQLNLMYKQLLYYL